MASKNPEPTPSGADAAGGAAPAAPSSSGGGFKAWLPLVATVIAMPVLAYATTTFFLLPKLKSAIGNAQPAAAEADAGEHGQPAEHGEKEGAGESKGEEKGEKKGEAKGEGEKNSHAKPKYTVTFNKIIANVAQSSGTRYLMVSMTLMGNNSGFKGLVEDHKDQLLDLANSTLSSKTIVDLEKQGARNQIRSELISVFNNALGNAGVQEIYFTEFAIQ
jgi:flagellar FliL protein